jgi:hypothetical protein
MFGSSNGAERRLFLSGTKLQAMQLGQSSQERIPTRLGQLKQSIVRESRSPRLLAFGKRLGLRFQYNIRGFLRFLQINETPGLSAWING